MGNNKRHRLLLLDFLFFCRKQEICHFFATRLTALPSSVHPEHNELQQFVSLFGDIPVRISSMA